jgi:antitoxin ParD1/3/4
MWAVWHKLPMEVVALSTRNVVLSQHQHELVESLVEHGRYQNASEVLRAGLRLLERQELEDAARLAALRDASNHGWSDLAVGRFDDVADGSLDDFIGQLGTRAAWNNAAN